jgi:mannose-6-phosphate isomerase-like protein (cupin superfamily)
MSGYTKVNLQDLNNSSQTEGNEAHFSRKFLDSKELGVSLFRFMPNYKSGRAHKHRVQEEVYVVIKGSGRILLDDKVEELKPWDTVRVASETVRSFASGPEGLEIIAIGGNKPEEGDGEPQDAEWPS